MPKTCLVVDEDCSNHAGHLNDVCIQVYLYLKLKTVTKIVEKI